MDLYSTTPIGAGAPYRDILSLLTADHEQVSELFEQFQSALENESGDAQELAERICLELELHTQLEEEIFYPALSAEPSLTPLVDEALSAHDEVTATIGNIRALDATDPAFGTLMMQLIEDVENHIDEEENVIFPEVERHMQTEVTELAMQFAERKRELQAERHLS